MHASEKCGRRYYAKGLRLEVATNEFTFAEDKGTNHFLRVRIAPVITQSNPDTANHLVTTLARTAGNYGSNDGTGSAARFNYPFGVAVDGSGNIYVAATGNHTIRKGVPQVDAHRHVIARR